MRQEKNFKFCYASGVIAIRGSSGFDHLGTQDFPTGVVEFVVAYTAMFGTACSRADKHCING